MRLASRSWVVVCLLCAPLVGCQRWNWRGEGYDRETNELTANLRGGDDEKQFGGFDQRARDIERNLGVR